MICAIGDVHGEAERLSFLHTLLLDRHRRDFPDHQLLIVHLGDYVDRGPDSARVIEYCQGMAVRPDIETVFLKGNHEDMMIQALADPGGRNEAAWLSNGGRETLESYRREGLADIPDHHLEWLKTRPILHIEPDARLIFVHAGIDPATFPNEVEQTYLWTRSPRFFEVETWKQESLAGWTVVHGHTPTSDFYPEMVEASSRRINLDTGATFGGRLTAAIFADGQPVDFCYA